MCAARIVYVVRKRKGYTGKGGALLSINVVNLQLFSQIKLFTFHKASFYRYPIFFISFDYQQLLLPQTDFKLDFANLDSVHHDSKGCRSGVLAYLLKMVDNNVNKLIYIISLLLPFNLIFFHLIQSIPQHFGILNHFLPMTIAHSFRQFWTTPRMSGVHNLARSVAVALFITTAVLILILAGEGAKDLVFQRWSNLQPDIPVAIMKRHVGDLSPRDDHVVTMEFLWT